MQLFKTLCYFIFCTLLLCNQAFSQDSVNIKSSVDSTVQIFNFNTASTIINTVNKQRVTWVAGAHIVGYVGSLAGLYTIWYKNYPQTNFHFINDNKEWMQVDKVGHAYSAYIESRAGLEMWKWTGMSKNKSIWMGGLTGAAYQTTIEILDGFSAEWGWSWGDFAANTLGSGLLISQELAWGEQRISYKFSFHKKKYTDEQLNERSNQLYGRSLPERMFKDYNAQTYWLSINLKSFFKQSKLPNWLNLAVGYGAENLFGPYANAWTDINKNLVIRNDWSRYRQFYIAPDIDFTRIKTKSKFLKAVFFALNAFKFPSPSIEFSQGKLRWNWIHF